MPLCSAYKNELSKQPAKNRQPDAGKLLTDYKVSHLRMHYSGYSSPRDPQILK
jgi:hypothetical protein